MQLRVLPWAIPLTVAIAAFWIVSACANWHFGASLGTDDEFNAILFTTTTAQLFSSASLASDVIKALMLLPFAAAVTNRQWAAAAVTAMIWASCMAWSVSSAIGFVALNHASVTDTRGKGMIVWSGLEDEIKRLQDRRRWIPHHRPAATVKADITGKEADYLFTRSSSCTNATVTDSIALCTDIARLKAELANAEEAAKLDADLSRLRSEVKNTTRVTSVSPFAEMIAGLLATTYQRVTVVQALALAMILELSTGLGLWAVWASALGGRRKPVERHIEVAKPITREEPSAPPEPIPAAPMVRHTVSFRPDLARKPIPVKKPVENVETKPKRKAKLTVAIDNTRPTNAADRPDVIDVYTRRFLDQATEPSMITLGAAAKDIYEAYSSWCKSVPIKPVSSSHFGRSVKRLGVKSEKRKSGVAYNLKLKRGIRTG